MSTINSINPKEDKSCHKYAEKSQLEKDQDTILNLSHYEKIQIYMMNEYKFCNLCCGRVTKLKDLKHRVEEGLVQFDLDYNLDELLIDLKTRNQIIF